MSDIRELSFDEIALVSGGGNYSDSMSARIGSAYGRSLNGAGRT